MVKKFIAIAVLMASAGSAQAASFIFHPGQGNSGTQAIFANFNNPANDGIVTGAVNTAFLSGYSNSGASPATGDHSRYLSVLANGMATINFGSAVNGFSAIVGSLDTYNTLTVLFAGGGSQSWTGSQLNAGWGAADGNALANRTNGRLDVFAGAGPLITGIKLQSGSNSFEIDDLALGAVPEPGTWAMMLAGFGAVGGALRRRTPRRAMQAV